MTHQTNNRKSFIIHKDSIEILDKLTDEQAGKLFKAIKFYQKNQEIPKLDLTLDLVFTPFLNQFIRDDEFYKKTCEARKEAGSKGGKQKLANASKCKQKVANLADSDSKNKSESESESKIKNEIKSEIINKKFIKPTLEELQEYISTREIKIDAQKFLDHYDAVGWKVSNNPMKDWKACVRTWEGRNYGTTNKQNTFLSADERRQKQNEEVGKAFLNSNKISIFSKHWGKNNE